MGVALLVAAPALGQVTPPGEPPPPSASPGPFAAVAAVPRPWTTVVATTVVLPSGSAADPEGLEGGAFLLGEAVRAAVLSAVGAGTVAVDVDVDRSHAIFRLVSAPEAWDRAFEALDDALFGEALTAASWEAARAGLSEVFTFESGAPVREFEREAFRLLAGASDPWSRDPRGTPTSLGRVGFPELSRVRRSLARREGAVVTVAGPVDPERVFRLLTDGPAARPDPGSNTLSAVRSDGTRPGGEAWSEGERSILTRDVTNSWIAAGWPVDPETSRTALEMLVHRLDGILDTSPPDPGVFSVDVGIEDRAGRPVLLVRAAVLPEDTQRWEDRILEAVEGIGSEALDAGFFRWQRRRFRNDRLLDEAAPEVEGLRVAMDLLREGRVRDLTAEIWDLGPDDLEAAADDLGEPRILVFGPDLSNAGSR